MTRWKLEDAKNRFSELVRRALADGPQLVTRHGKEAVVVLSTDEYRRLASPGDLLSFLRASPLSQALASGELEISRDSDLPRDTVL